MLKSGSALCFMALSTSFMGRGALASGLGLGFRSLGFRIFGCGCSGLGFRV